MRPKRQKAYYYGKSLLEPQGYSDCNWVLWGGHEYYTDYTGTYQVELY